MGRDYVSVQHHGLVSEREKNFSLTDRRDRHKADVYLKRLVFSNLLVYCGVSIKTFHEKLIEKKERCREMGIVITRCFKLRVYTG